MSNMTCRDNSYEWLEARVRALEAALRRTDEHMRSFAEISPLDRTAETDAIIYCNSKLLEGA